MKLVPFLVAGFARALVSLRNRLHGLFGSGYLRAVTLLSSTSGVAMALPILAAPVLSRLYSPVDYGVLAIFMMISNIVGGMSTLQLHLGIVAERSERHAEILMRITIAASVLLSLLLLPVAVLLAVSLDGVGPWMLLLPMVSLVAGLSTTVSSIANRHGAYRSLAFIPLAGTVTIVAVSLAGGLAGLGHHGLLLGYLAGQTITAALFLRALFGPLRPRPQHLTARRIRLSLRRQRSYLTWSLPTSFIDRANREAPNYVLAVLGNVQVLGSYTRARQLLALPVNVLGGAIGQVFFQRASDEVARTGSCRRIWVRTFLGLFGLGAPATIALAIIAPDLFRIALGAQWVEAGEIAQLLAPMLFGSFVCAPLASVFYIAGRQKEDFWLMLTTFALFVALGFAVVLASLSMKTSISLFSATYTMVYVVYILRSYQLSGAILSRRERAASQPS